jgi:hypothetical protein
VTNSESGRIQFYDHGSGMLLILDYKFIFHRYNVIIAGFLEIEAYAVGN